MSRSVQQAVIVSAARTPIARFCGAFSELSAVDLGAVATRAAIERAGLSPDVVDEVILGMVFPAGVGAAPARQVARAAGVPDHAGALTINKMCGSGLKAVMLAAQAVQLGDAEVVLAGGMESMTRAPYLLQSGRNGLRLGHGELRDSLFHDGLLDPYHQILMGETAELAAERYKVSRHDQDEFALASHRKAVAAASGRRFSAEIAPVSVPRHRAEPLLVTADDGPRSDVSLEGLAGLPPVFRREGGTVTAGNASTLNDGASALLIMSAQRAQQLGCPVRASIRGYATGGLDPRWVMMAPVDAVERLGRKIGARNDDYELVELNEAFSAQAVAVTRECGFDPARVNVHGGAVALGHPVGASGARILTTLLHAMEQHDRHLGLATLCLGGGNAVALAVER